MRKNNEKTYRPFNNSKMTNTPKEKVVLLLKDNFFGVFQRQNLQFTVTKFFPRVLALSLKVLKNKHFNKQGVCIFKRSIRH